MASPARILVVEDDPKVRDTLRLYLAHAGFEVDVAGDGRRALELAGRGGYDLIVLDLLLPELDGLAVCRRLREESEVPVVMVTARTTEEDRLRGFETGADDYLPKPFSPRELVARVRAVLRRAVPAQHRPQRPLRFDGLLIDPARREVLLDGEPVRLTATQFDLLLTLAESPGRVLTRTELVERAMGPDFEGLDRTVDAHVSQLRRRLEPDRARPSFIETVFGVGYRFAGRPAAEG